MDSIFELRFKLVTKNGDVLKDIPYKTVVSGTQVKNPHIKDAATDDSGQTAIVSTTANEIIDLHIVWAKLKVNKDERKTSPDNILPKR